MSPLGPIKKWYVHRCGAWGLLIGLTGLLLLLPIQFALPDYFHPVQPLLLFGSFRTFALLYVAWIALLVALLTTARSGNTQHWEQLALLSVFAIGFLYYWIMFTPWGRLWDEPYQLAIVKQVYALGGVSNAPASLPYMRWPMSHILAAMSMSVARVSLLEVRNSLVLANILLTTGLLYLFLRYCTGSGLLASLGVIVAIQSNPIVIKMSFFFPQAFGMTFLLFLLAILAHYLPMRAEKTSVVLTLLTFAVLTATHAITALAFAFVLVGVHVVGKVWRTPHDVRTGLVGVLVVIWGAWLLYSAHDVFRSGVVGLSRLVSRDADPLYYIVRTARLKVFATDYWWAELTRTVWLSLTWLVGPALWLYRLPRSRIGHAQELVLVGGMLGIFLTTIVVAAASPGGQQAFRYQLYGPIFAVSLLLTAADHVKPPLKRLMFGAAWLGAAALSLPSLLVFNNSVLFDTTYQQEWSAASFASSNLLAKQSPPILIPSTILEGPYYLYNPTVRILTPPTLEKLKDSSEFFGVLSQYVRDDRSSKMQATSRTVVWSRKLPLLGTSAFGIGESDYRWGKIVGYLNERDLIYQNGLMGLFQSSP